MSITQKDNETVIGDVPSGAERGSPGPTVEEPVQTGDSAGEIRAAIGGRPPGSVNGTPGLDRILHLQVPMRVELADRMMPLSALLDLNVGSIIEFSVLVDTDLSLLVANKRIGFGTAVKAGEKFGLRVNRINSVKDRISALGG